MGVRPLRRGRISRENAQPPSEMSICIQIWFRHSGFGHSVCPSAGIANCRRISRCVHAVVGSGRTKLWRRELCSAGVLGKTKQGKEGVRAVMNIFHFVWPRKAESDATIWISVYKRDGWLLGPFVHKLTATKVVSHGYLIRRTWLPFTLCTEPRETHATPFDACAPWSNPSLRHPRRLLFPTL